MDPQLLQSMVQVSMTTSTPLAAPVTVSSRIPVIVDRVWTWLLSESPAFFYFRKTLGSAWNNYVSSKYDETTDMSLRHTLELMKKSFRLLLTEDGPTTVTAFVLPSANQRFQPTIHFGLKLHEAYLGVLEKFQSARSQPLKDILLVQLRHIDAAIAITFVHEMALCILRYRHGNIATPEQYLCGDNKADAGDFAELQFAGGISSLQLAPDGIGWRLTAYIFKNPRPEDRYLLLSDFAAEDFGRCLASKLAPTIPIFSLATATPYMQASSENQDRGGTFSHRTFVPPAVSSSDPTVVPSKGPGKNHDSLGALSSFIGGPVDDHFDEPFKGSPAVMDFTCSLRTAGCILKADDLPPGAIERAFDNYPAPVIMEFGEGVRTGGNS